VDARNILGCTVSRCPFELLKLPMSERVLDTDSWSTTWVGILTTEPEITSSGIFAAVRSFGQENILLLFVLVDKKKNMIR